MTEPLAEYEDHLKAWVGSDSDRLASAERAIKTARVKQTINIANDAKESSD